MPLVYFTSAIQPADYTFTLDPTVASAANSGGSSNPAFVTPVINGNQVRYNYF